MARKGYIQLVNGFYMNRKVRKLRHTCPSAVGAFAMMLAFCGDNLSDGHISEDDALYVLDISDSELDALCEVGMIEPDGNDGYYIHDYLEHNRSKEQVQKKRETNSENYKNGKSEPKTSDSDAIQTSESNLNRDKHQNTRTPEELSKDNSTPPTPSQSDDEDYPLGFNQFWEVYPRHEGKRTAFAEWKKARRKTNHAFLLAKAGQYAADPNRESRFTLTPANWLKGEHWDDDPLPAKNAGRSMQGQDQNRQLIEHYAALEAAQGRLLEC